MKLTLNLKIDMFLDGYLTLQLVTDEAMYKPVTAFCTPNANQRDNRDLGRFNPIAEETELKFLFDLRDDLPSPLYIDLDRSILEIGFAGKQNKWVGPGKLFTYKLSTFMEADDQSVRKRLK